MAVGLCVPLMAKDLNLETYTPVIILLSVFLRQMGLASETALMASKASVNFRSRFLKLVLWMLFALRPRIEVFVAHPFTDCSTKCDLG